MAKSDILVRWKADTSQYDANIAKAKRQLEGFTKENLTAGGALKQLTSGLVSTAAKFASIGAAASVAMKSVKDSFLQSESNIDEWGRTLEGAKGAYNIFLDTLNSGNWSQFFANLSTAIQGGRDLYDALDRLGSIKANNQFAIAVAQTQIQQLRVLKQQGMDVDTQIKAATERLKGLQMQSVNAGKSAGARQLVTTLSNRVNAAGGRGLVSGRELGLAAAEYARRGQSYVDEQASIFRQLDAIARRPSSTVQGATAGSLTIGGGVDLSRLTNEQRKQYIIAQAVTEGETELQKALGTLTQSVQEEASVFREQFRGNRFAGASRGGGAGSRSSSGSLVSGGMRGLLEFDGVSPYSTESMKSLRDQLAMYRKAADSASNPLASAQALQGISDTQAKMRVQPMALRLGISAESMLDIEKDMAKLTETIPPLEIKTTVNTASLKMTEQDALKAASAIGSIGSALQSIEDPGAKVAGIIATAIASIAATFAGSLKGTFTPWDWIAAAAAGTATLVSTIAAIKSATAGSFANGGVVPGNSFSGDRLIASVNSGETILNASQTRNLASYLQRGGDSDVASRPYVSGENIYLGLTTYLRRRGRGELVTTR